jgi:hypothetical protein
MKQNHLFHWLLLIVLSLLPLLDLLHSGLPLTHDGPDHVARISNFYQSLREGNLVPRWAGNLNWGFGHPILMFLYPLPSYVASAFHLMGFSFVDSTKLVFAAAFIGSMAAMFLWAGSLWGTDVGLAAAVLYGYAPYRFVDMYVRGAIGEHMAFVFLPVILWGIAQAGKNKRFSPKPLSVIAVGTGLLILSHNALSLMFLPICISYAWYVARHETKRMTPFFWHILLAMGYGFLLSAFFWAPAFFEGKYTLRDIVTKDPFGDRFVSWSRFIYSPWNYLGGNEFSKSLGVAQLVTLILLPWVYRHMSRAVRGLTVVVAALLLGSLFIMTTPSESIWNHVSIMQKFQFPWRFLSVSVAAIAVLDAIILSALPERLRKAGIWAVIAVAVLSSFGMARAKTYSEKPQSYYTGVYRSTTDTGESSPIWSVRFMEHTATASMEVIDGDATISESGRTSVRHEYLVDASKDTSVVENTLYFPGWEVFVDSAPVHLEFQNPEYRGLMTFTVPAGRHSVTAVFRETRLRRIADYVSIASFVLLFGVLGTMIVWKKRTSP